MATEESQKLMERRLHQRRLEEWRVDPEVQTLNRQLEARRRYQARHPFSGRPPSLLRMHCIVTGTQLGGRPSKARRCTKRLRSHYCWN